jgi:hypothetical protein
VLEPFLFLAVLEVRTFDHEPKFIRGFSGSPPDKTWTNTSGYKNNRSVNLSLHDLLILNGAIVIFVIVSFLLVRKSARQPVRLRLNEKVKLDTSEAAAATGARSASSAGRSSAAQSAAQPSEFSASPEKSLNVIFNYNGHSWDAFEVLGVPAGSSPDAIKAGYEKLLSKTDPESAEFLRTAYEATRGR